MQISGTRHSSTVSVEFTASLASGCTGSDVLRVAICTRGVSGGSICERSGNAASTASDPSHPSVPVTVAAAVRALSMDTPASPLRGGARRSSTGTASVFLKSGKLKPSTTALATTTVPHSAATLANRRGASPGWTGIEYPHLSKHTQRKIIAASYIGKGLIDSRRY